MYVSNILGLNVANNPKILEANIERIQKKEMIAYWLIYWPWMSFLLGIIQELQDGHNEDADR